MHVTLANVLPSYKFQYGKTPGDEPMAPRSGAIKLLSGSGNTHYYQAYLIKIPFNTRLSKLA